MASLGWLPTYFIPCTSFWISGRLGSLAELIHEPLIMDGWATVLLLPQGKKAFWYKVIRFLSQTPKNAWSRKKENLYALWPKKQQDSKGLSPKVPKLLKELKKITKKLRGTPRSSRERFLKQFQNNSKESKRFQKIPKDSKRIQKIRKDSKKIPKDSKNILKDSKKLHWPWSNKLQAAVAQKANGS